MKITFEDAGAALGEIVLGDDETKMLLAELGSAAGIADWVKGALLGKIDHVRSELGVRARAFIADNKVDPSAFKNFSEAEFIRVMLEHPAYAADKVVSARIGNIL
jgi:hypothetical protein